MIKTITVYVNVKIIVRVRLIFQNPILSPVIISTK